MKLKKKKALRIKKLEGLFYSSVNAVCSENVGLHRNNILS